MSTSYKQLIGEAKTLTANNGKNAHRVAEILRQLFNDPKFLEDHCEQSLDKRDDELAQFAGRFALGVNDMLQMINYFPLAKDWADGRLDILRDKTCRLMTMKTGRATDSESASQRRITVAMYEELQEKLKALKAENRRLKAELQELRAAVEPASV